MYDYVYDMDSAGEQALLYCLVYFKRQQQEVTSLGSRYCRRLSYFHYSMKIE